MTCFTPRSQENFNFLYGMRYENASSGGRGKPFVVPHQAGQNHHWQGPRRFSKDVDPRIAAIRHAQSQNAAQWDPNNEYSGPSGPPFSDSYENAAMWRNREDWRKVSRVLDRLGLILTFLFVVALCLFLFIGIRA